jgi:hypothetical protein
MKGLTSPKREPPFLKEPPNHPLQQAIHDLHRASRISLKAGPGSRPSDEGQNDSFHYPDPKQIKIKEIRRKHRSAATPAASRCGEPHQPVQLCPHQPR